MGARNVSGALAMYPDLGHRAMRLLIGMSLTALDHPTQMQPAQCYFGGREHQAEILGYRLPATPDESDAAKKTRANAYEQVRRAVDELVRADAIVRTRAGTGGWRSEYFLRVVAMPVDNQAPEGHQKGGSQGHLKGGSLAHPEGGPMGHQKGAP